MDTTPTTDAVDALRRLTPDQIETRIADLDAERAMLSRMLRSLQAGERARQRTQQRTPAREVQQ
jgi:hypothetical protein